MKDISKEDTALDDAKRNAEIEALRRLTQNLVEEGRSRRAKKQQQAGPTKNQEPSER